METDLSVAQATNDEFGMIILESFAMLTGPPGFRRRAWAGWWDRPLVAWAGICITGDMEGCAGLLTLAHEPVSRVSPHMPRLLTPQDHAIWLEGRGPLSLSPPFSEDDYYLEDLGELWSTGLPVAEGHASTDRMRAGTNCR